MKKLSIVFAFILSLLPGLCEAQTAPDAQNSTTPESASYTIVSRNANSRVWEWTENQQGPDGQTIPKKHHYIEMASGLCYQQNGQWLDSREDINILPDGSAEAIQGQHQAYFPADIYQGVITLVTSDGLQLKSQPLGLSYDDGTNIVLIAELTNSVGQLINSNQILYPNAFSGVDADLLYTYKKSGFEQDVIFRQQPPAPEQFGFDSSYTRLQLLTEFFNSPAPHQIISPISPQDGMQDTALAFGAMRMVRGHAFLAGKTNLQNNLDQVSVYKSWINLDGRTLLLEQLPYQKLSHDFSILPASPSLTLNSAGSMLGKTSSRRLIPPTRLAGVTTNTVRLARIEFMRKPGVVLDYVTIDAAETNFVFRGDTTYCISNEFDLCGTTIFEGGTVVKMVERGQIDIDENGAVDCETGPYRPAVFTSVNDNTVGETIGGSTDSPDFTDVGQFILFGPTNAVIHDLRFSYCLLAVYQLNWPSTLDIWNCQFVNLDAAAYGWNLALHNVLIGLNVNADPELETFGPSLIAENVTADQGNAFEVGYYDGITTLALTNCIIAGSPLVGDGVYTERTAPLRLYWAFPRILPFRLIGPIRFGG